MNDSAEVRPGPTIGGAALDAMLEHAHIPTLLMSLVQMTDDDRWLIDRYRPERPRGGIDPDDGGLDESVQLEIREAARDAYLSRSNANELRTPHNDESLHNRICFYTGDEVARDTLQLAAEELGLTDRDQALIEDLRDSGPMDISVVIAGAGLSGLGLAMKLKAANVQFVLLERGPSIGGVWLDNAYPGSGVDSPAHLYQYSFAAWADWPDYYSKREHILQYFQRCVDKFDIAQHIRFNVEVSEAVWNETAQNWTVSARSGGGVTEYLRPNIFVSAVGQLNQPIIPTLPGQEQFSGTSVHTADWRSDIQTEGLNVAVVGTGASAVQFVPAIVDSAKRVTVFQRSPQWTTPNPMYRRTVSREVRWLLRNMPGYSEWYRYRQFWFWNDNIHPTLQIDPEWPHSDRSINAENDRAREFLTRHIAAALDGRPDLLSKCVPTYPPYGKRMLMDNEWFATLTRENVELVDDPIAEINPAGVMTSGGKFYPADVIAYATGFDAHRLLYPMNIVGRGGVELRDLWQDDDPYAYLGMSVPQFPNMFVLYGPNTNLGHGGSITFHAECQFRYILGMLAVLQRENVSSFEVKDDVCERYNARVDELHDQMIWTHKGMSTWYRNRAGRVVSNSPWRLRDYWEMTREPDLGEYILTGAMSVGRTRNV